MANPAPQEIWQHYKTKGEYEILGVGQLQSKVESLDMAPIVLYKSLSDGNLWARPLADFLETVSDETGKELPRFTKTR